jgi:hypothetical protein
LTRIRTRWKNRNDDIDERSGSVRRRSRASEDQRRGIEAAGDAGRKDNVLEPRAGDYIRKMTWPIVEGTSLMHLHLNQASGHSCSTSARRQA